MCECVFASVRVHCSCTYIGLTSLFFEHKVVLLLVMSFSDLGKQFSSWNLENRSNEDLEGTPVNTNLILLDVKKLFGFLYTLLEFQSYLGYCFCSPYPNGYYTEFWVLNASHM